MAFSTRGAIVAAVLLGFHVSNCAAIPAAGSVVRKEATHQVSLSPDGRFVEEANVTATFTDSGHVPENPCAVDYILGVEGKSECQNASTHSLINSSDHCRLAANLTGHDIDELHFIIQHDSQMWYEKHPRGCFVWPCGAAGGSTTPENGKKCFYYNPVDQQQETTFDGTTVCFRARYMQAPADPLDKAPADYCYEGYEPILDEKAARDYALCSGIGEGDDFIIGVHNKSKHDEYPLGAFKMTNLPSAEDTPRIYYNPEVLYNGEDWIPGHAIGVPVCNVSETLLVLE